MKTKKILCLVLCVLLFCCSCGTKSKPVAKKTVKKDNTVVSIPYHILFCYTDSINPFKAITQVNQELGLLLFDPLIKLDSNNNPVYCIASSATVQDRTCTVVINNVSFSDGSPVTVSDIAFSTNLAKSSNRFSQQLSNLSSVNIANGNTLVFSLFSPDPNFVNLLDYPIIKQGTESLVNQDNIALPPIGCGKYILNDKLDKLTANENYFMGAPLIKNVELQDAPDSESVSQRIRSGEILTYYSDLSDNKVPNMNGKAVSVPLNNLVYIGCNMRSGIFVNFYARQAVSSAINRSAIVKQAYYDNARIATGPFPSNWEPAKKFQNISKTASTDIAVENFDHLGYNKDEQGNYINANGDRVSVSLLVNSDNTYRMSAANIIASQLKAVGITVVVNALPYDSYVAYLQAGNFDLFIAETRLLNNLDISQLVTVGGSCAYGIASNAPQITDPVTGEITQQAVTVSDINTTTGAAVAAYKNGTMSLSDMITVFNTELPIIPICYRNGIFLYNEKITVKPTPSVSDIYLNFNEFSVK